MSSLGRPRVWGGPMQLPLPKVWVGGGFGTPVLPHSHSWQAKTKGLQSGVDIGVKYSEKQQRNFDETKMKAGQCVIGLQVGTGSHGWGGGLGKGFPLLSNSQRCHSSKRW